MKIENGVTFYDADEAIAMLPPDGDGHVFLNPHGMLIGADWSQKELEELLRTSETIRKGGEQCLAMGHGLVAWKDGKNYFIKTKDGNA